MYFEDIKFRLIAPAEDGATTLMLSEAENLVGVYFINRKGSIFDETRYWM